MTQDGLGTLRPNFKVHLPKYNQDIEINSWGMRDRERSIAKGTGVVRILVPGDSFREAVQVSYQHVCGLPIEKLCGRPSSFISALSALLVCS